MIIRKLSDSAPRKKGEETLLAGLSSGEIVETGGADRPGPDAGPDRQVRAEFLRYLLLGGCDELIGEGIRLHEKGVQLWGALITGHLDLQGCRTRDLLAVCCRFDTAPTLRGAAIPSICLNGSSLPGLFADRLDAKGTVFLRGAKVRGQVRLLGATLGGDLVCAGATLTAGEGGEALSADGLDAKGGVVLRGATVTGQVRLPGATLGGDLSCIGATLTVGEGGDALNADGLDARGGVFFGGATVTGQVRLLGATLGSDLVCAGATLTAGEGGKALSADGLDAKGGVVLRGATVTGQVRLPGATLGGGLDCTGALLTAGAGGFAMSLDNARIGGAWFWRHGASASGILGLGNATIGTIADDPACWRGEARLILDRCQYSAFMGGGVSGRERCDWLRLQPAPMLGRDFLPQPWEQCAKVLREMGHVEDARAVLIEKERLQRRAKRMRLRSEHLYEDAYLRSVADAVLGVTVRYGRQPLLAFLWLFGFWLAGVFVFATAASHDAIKPNATFVLRSPEWAFCAEDYEPLHNGKPELERRNEGTSQLACFRAQLEASTYPRFNAAIYSADTLLPIVSMEMQDFWIPDETRGFWPAAARWYLWLHIAAGWALSLLAVAGFSGLVKSD